MESSRLSLLWALTCGLTRENGRTDSVNNVETCKHVPLKRKYSQLVSSITCVGDIVAQLFQSRMLTEKERDALQSLASTPITANEELLNILMTKPRTVYERFLMAIRNTNQDHVYRMLISESEFECPDNFHRGLIQTDYSWLVEKLDSSNELLIHLCQYGVLTDREREQIDALTDRFRKSEKLLSVVGMKSSDNFKLFIQALKDTNQHHIAERFKASQSPIDETTPEHSGVTLVSSVQLRNPSLKSQSINTCKPPVPPKLIRNLFCLTSPSKQNKSLRVKRNYSKVKAICVQMQNRVLTDVWIKAVLISQNQPEVSYEIVKMCLLEILQGCYHLQSEVMQRNEGGKQFEKVVRKFDSFDVSDRKKLESEVAFLKRELAKQKIQSSQQVDKEKDAPSDKENDGTVRSVQWLLIQTHQRKREWTVMNNFGNLPMQLPNTGRDELVPTAEDKLGERDYDSQETRAALESAKRKLVSIKSMYEELLRSVKPKRHEPAEKRNTSHKNGEICELSSKEVYTLKFNRTFLLENLDCSLLIELLQSRRCISDKEADRINGQPNASFKRGEFLHWMCSATRNQYKTIVDCIRRTNQQFLATLLENGGVIVKSSVSFGKKFTRYRELVHQLNAISCDSTSRFDKHIQKLKNLKIEIAPCCCLDEKTITVWFWCRSQSALRKLQEMYKRNNLKDRLNKIFRNVLQNGDGGPHQRCPDSIACVHIYPEEFRKIFRNMDYQRDLSYVEVLSTRAAGRDNRPVIGLAILHEELFVLCSLGSEVVVFDRMKLSLSERRKITGLQIPGDIASSPVNNILYVLDWRKDDQSSEIVAIEPSGRTVNRWLIGCNCRCGGVSVTCEGNVVVTDFSQNKIQEYNWIGQLVCVLALPDLVHPWHAVKLSGGCFVISHGWGDDQLQRVCMLDAYGAVVASFGEDKTQVLHEPMHLTVDADENILVADHGNRGLLMLGATLEFKRQLVADKGRLQRPRKMALDESNCRLFVVDDSWKDGRILVFDIN